MASWGTLFMFDLLDIQILLSSRDSDSHSYLILHSIVISLAVVAASTLDLGHVAISRCIHVGVTVVLLLEDRLWVNRLKLGVEVG